jgi:zinc and cadmium transporter
MSAIALVGSATLLMRPGTLDRILFPLVALAAGSLLGGALFHLVPESVDRMGNRIVVYGWIAAGFGSFLVLEQLLHWHHCHRAVAEHHRPLTYLLLIGDGVHNFIGGLAVASAFVTDIRLGITTWLVAAAHEVPQELGDFGVLVHGGWSRRRALAFNLLSALTFPIGGVVAYLSSIRTDVGFLLPFAAGNFIYIAAVDLVPEIKEHPRLSTSLQRFAAFMGGMAVLWLLASLE